MENPKAEVVQEEKPKASVVGWAQMPNSLENLVICGLEDWSCASRAVFFQLIDVVGKLEGGHVDGFQSGFLAFAAFVAVVTFPAFVAFVTSVVISGFH